MLIINPDGKAIIDWLQENVGVIKSRIPIPISYIKGMGWNITISTAFNPNTGQEYVTWHVEIQDPEMQSLFALKWR